MIETPDYHKNPDIRFSKRLEKLFFRGRQEGVVIECGAVDGLTNSIGHYYESLGWKAINIEPNPHDYSKLVVNRPNSVNLNLALSNEVGESELLWPTDNSTWGTIEEGVDFPRRSTHTTPVQMTTYANLVSVLQLERLDLFILDVEGHELSVLEDVGDWTVQPEILVVETNKPGVSPDDVTSLLGPAGYVVANNDRNNTYYRKA